jgi:hypothetical protein
MQASNRNQVSAARRVLTLFSGGLLAAALVVCCGQLSCAEVDGGWDPDDPPNKPGDGGSHGDMPDGDGVWRCYTGVPTTEEQFLNRCTEAEHVDRPSSIPPATWDGKSPLPFPP